MSWRFLLRKHFIFDRAWQTSSSLLVHMPLCLFFSYVQSLQWSPQLVCEWPVASSIYSTRADCCPKTVKMVLIDRLQCHRPWIWIIMVWAFSTDIVYFWCACPQARKQLFRARLRNSHRPMPGLSLARAINQLFGMSVVSPLNKIRRGIRLSTRESAQRLITSDSCLISLLHGGLHADLPRCSYFWKGELSIKFTWHYLVDSIAFEYFSTDLKKAFRNEIYCLFWCHNCAFSFP